MGQNAHVFVAAAREVHHQYVMSGERGGKLQGLGDGVSALQCRQNAFRAGKPDDRIEGCSIALRDVFGASGVVEGGVLGTDGGVVQTR